MPLIEAFPESKEISESIRGLTKIINQKQSLIVSVTQKLGEFVSGFRSIRKGVDDIKSGNADEDVVSTMEKYGIRNNR